MDDSTGQPGAQSAIFGLSVVRVMIDRLRIAERLVQLGPSVSDADIVTVIDEAGVKVIFDVRVSHYEGDSLFRSEFVVTWFDQDAVGRRIEQAMGEFVEVTPCS